MPGLFFGLTHMKAFSLAIVSGNRHKFNEIKKKLEPFGIRLEWIKASLKEGKGSLEKTAISKARQAFSIVKAPVIAEDTGVFFEAFENWPGAKAKRVFEKIGFKGLLKKIEGKSRKARFETIICFTADGKKFKSFKGVFRGAICGEVHDRNKDVLPYEKIFIPAEMKKTLSSLPRSEKNKFSHRAQAAEKLGKWLEANL
ncbi:MAG: non-canonical purine NTP pyrophosphatase [Candidatus Diapherotrites archaeon]